MKLFVSRDEDKLTFSLFYDEPKQHIHTLSIRPTGREAIDIEKIKEDLASHSDKCEVCKNNQKLRD